MFRLRYVVGILGSAAITVGLFLFMMGLVTTESEDDQEVVDAKYPKILRDEVVEVSKPDERIKPERPEQQDPPPPPDPIDVRPTKVDGPTGSSTIIGFPEHKIGGAPVFDRPKHIIRYPPIYPERCRAKELEGRVVLEFDISPTGSVENARVIESAPTSCFDRASIKAIKQWKFEPKVINGKAVQQYGVQEVIEYEFEDDA